MLETELATGLTELKVDDPEEQTVNKFFYKRLTRHYIADEVRKDNKEAVLTTAAYHRKTKILVTGILDFILA